MPTLFLLVPLVLALVASLFFRRVGKRLAAAIKDYPTLKIAIPLAVMVSGSISAVALDMLDVSEILFQARDLINDRVSNLSRNLESIYKVQEPHLTAVRDEFTNIVESLKPSQTKEKQCVLALSVGVFGGITLLLSVFGAAAEHQLTEELVEKERKFVDANARMNECKARFDAACQLLAQLGTVVGAKQRRIKRLMNEKANLQTCENRLQFLCNALSPGDQLQAIVTCAHEFLWQKTRANLKLRVALYTPQNSHLIVRASTDGNSSNVVVSPNTKHRDFFVLDGGMPRCVTCDAFAAKKPIIIQDCDTHQSFRPFSEPQKNRLKSMFACPLIHGNDDNLGVLVADANIAGFFEDKPEFRLLLEQMGSEIALRLMLENTMNELLETAVEKKG